MSSICRRLPGCAGFPSVVVFPDVLQLPHGCRFPTVFAAVFPARRRFFCFRSRKHHIQFFQALFLSPNSVSRQRKSRLAFIRWFCPMALLLFPASASSLIISKSSQSSAKPRSLLIFLPPHEPPDAPGRQSSFRFTSPLFSCLQLFSPADHLCCQQTAALHRSNGCRTG